MSINRRINFKPVEAEDIPIISPYFAIPDFRTCDFSIGGMFMWRKYFETSYLLHEDCLFFKIKYFDGQICFTFPLGHISIDRSLDLLEEYTINENIDYKFCTVPEEALSILLTRYGNRLNAVETRDWFDYLYNMDDLSDLKGNKYSGPRNHINRFLKLYPHYNYVKINENNIHKVQQFLLDYQGYLLKDGVVAEQEYMRTKELLSYFEFFNLFGGYIDIDNKIIAFTIGEVVNDTVFIHVEKALTEYHGAYQIIAKEFLKQFHPDAVRYVNREEDVGNLGLRKAKLAYHPIALLKKFVVSIK
ncbi:MAG: phosphatidylglycerol lysyltransferase domain-containing protein [Tannerella sp.]|jgi:hypothetical protein|nr:phosphatidylglycerol lysyltransferase domain-containing protein [Tannerella sp.]